MPIVRCRRCGSPTSGFAPRCAQCGAWRRVLGGADGDSPEWRRVVTFALAVAAVTIAFLDLRQLRRSEWLSDAGANAAPSPASVHTTRADAPAAETPRGPSQSARPPSTQRMPGTSSPAGAPATQRAAATNANSYGVPGGTNASRSEGAPAEAGGSMASSFADWFQRVAFGRGRDPGIARDSTDSLSVMETSHARSRSSSESTSTTLQSRLRDAAQRSVRRTSRVTNPR